MKITHDAKVNAWYIQLVEHVKRGEATIQKTVDHKHSRSTVLLDYNKEGVLLGIEILELL